MIGVEKRSKTYYQLGVLVMAGALQDSLNVLVTMGKIIHSIFAKLSIRF